MYQEFQIQLTDLTVENLLEQFTLAKHTGLEKPGKVHKSIHLHNDVRPFTYSMIGSCKESISSLILSLGPGPVMYRFTGYSVSA